MGKITVAEGRKIIKAAVRGLSLREIKGLDGIGVSHQTVLNRINDAGLHDIWLKSEAEHRARRREEEKKQKVELRREYQRLADNLNERMYQLSQGNWASREAVVEYFEGRQTITLEELIGLFQEYQKAEERGEKPSYDELGRRSGMSRFQAERILKRHSLEPLGWASKEKREAIKRAHHEIDMSNEDIAYFLGVSYHTVHDAFRRMGYRGVHYLNTHIHGVSSYRKMSQLYEAQDAGFTREETVEYSGLISDLVYWGIENRPEIEAKIINAFDVLYPGEKHLKPYLVHEQPHQKAA